MDWKEMLRKVANPTAEEMREKIEKTKLRRQLIEEENKIRELKKQQVPNFFSSRDTCRGRL